ncbi:MAG: nucleotidyltransferase domain-containing protein [Gammaproteobacteria bacterium]|nr:nucleotidyltransferase domain-containing protein [Gammaproteobacteria bacterium]
MSEIATLSEAKLRSCIDLLRARLPQLRAIYLFGSMATGDGHADSDADLAVLGTAAFDGVRIFELAAELADVLHRDVDLIDLPKASTVMRAQIIAFGRRIFGQGADLEAYECRSLSEYARLNEERAGILEDIARRGSVHG